MRVTIDAGGATWLPLCACGWRGLPQSSHGAALLSARHHELRAHPGDINAAKALTEWTRRHSRSSR